MLICVRGVSSGLLHVSKIGHLLKYVYVLKLTQHTNVFTSGFEFGDFKLLESWKGNKQTGLLKDYNTLTFCFIFFTVYRLKGMAHPLCHNMFSALKGSNLSFHFYLNTIYIYNHTIKIS